MRLRCRLGLHLWTESSQKPQGDRERKEYDDGSIRGWVEYQVFLVTCKCDLCGATHVHTERRRVDDYADEHRRDNR